MPKSAFKNPFGRRRSVGNALDFASPAESPDPTASSTFRVIERADKRGQNTVDGAERKLNSAPRSQPVRPFESPLQQLRGKSAEDILSGQNRYDRAQGEPLKNPRLINQRGSRGTTNSGSSGHYDSSGASARYSSTSTLPSSLEPEREPEEEDLFPTKRATAPMFSSSNPSLATQQLPQPPSFTSRASRALSFGLKGKTPPPRLDEAPPVPTVDRTVGLTSPARDRAMTTSSYASTAVPTKQDSRLAPIDLPPTDFGDDGFGDMFDQFKDRRASRGSPTPPALLGGFSQTTRADHQTARPSTHGETDSKPMYPPRSYSRQGALPSPNEMRKMRDNTASPYSLEGRRSNDGLMAGSAFNSPVLEHGPGIPAVSPAFLGGASRQGYAPVSEQMASPGAERLSFESHNSQREFVTGANKEPAYTSRQTHLDDGDRWGKKDASKAPRSSQSNHTAPTTSSSSTVRQPQAQVGPSNTSRARANSHQKSEGGDWLNDSQNATPKATRFAPRDEPLFDETSPVGPPSRALRPSEYAQQHTETGTPKKMTKAQFEILQKYGDKSAEPSEDESGSGDEYDDDDEEERAKQAIQQRRKQEANMSVYRQQMKKVTGGGPSDLPANRPGMDRAPQSASGNSGFYLGGIGGPPPPDTIRGKQSDDDDDEVPLGILQAHGFPSGSRPPTQLGGGDYSQRASVAGSVVGGGGGQGNLPAFARRLPQDPYFGAGLVNPANRESLAFGGGGGGSVYGGSPAASPMGHPMGTPGGHPGGLVGVIAGEERAKAARRATPSAAYGTTAPLPSNMPMQMPRTMSMGNIPPPSIYGGQGMPPMPPMPQMPPQMMPGQDSNQQMQQFMQMQMQFMQNMMAMQQQNMGQAPMVPQMPGNGFLSPTPSRPMSMASQAPNGGRSMTMMGPPSTWGQPPQQGARPGSSFQQYAPSVHNLQAGPGAGYTPSIAPSERSNIGMPSRYRPVSTMNPDSAMMSGGRSQSMTSSLTLQAFTNPQQQQPGEQARNGTIRVIDKPKGAPRIVSRAVEPEEDEDQGWSEMAKKRSERKWKWGRSKKEQPKEEPLGELYQNVE